MRLMFALLGILLIASGAIILGAPYLNTLQSEATVSAGPDAAATRSLKNRRVGRLQRQTVFDQVRSVAEKANAPLSIIFGFMSLYYTRRTYHAQSQR